MNCRESRQMIAVAVDGELSQKDAEHLALHLKSCEACGALIERESAFVKALRAQRPNEAMPASLKRQLLALVRDAQAEALPKPRRVWRWATAPLLAASALCFLLLQKPAPAEWTRFYLQEHSAHEAAAPQLQLASASPAQLAAWFQGALQRKVHIPRMPDARLLGGRICRMQGQSIGVALYQVEGKALSLFIGDTKILCPGGWALAENQIYAQPGAGLSLAAWAHAGHLHVAVSEIAMPRLRSLALECQASAI